MKNYFPLNFHLQFEYDIPDDSFSIDNTSKNIPCVFQIWEKRKEFREMVKKIKPKNYKFVKKEETPDVSFRRVGVYAGKIEKDTENKSPSSHYFIKFDTKLNDTTFIMLKELSFDCKNNTVGPKSISKQELIKELNEIL